MIEQFFQKMRTVETPKEAQEYISKLVETFDAYVDLLRNNETFPNPAINQIATLMWRLIGNKHISVAIDPFGTIPSVAFAILGDKDTSERQAIVFIPQNFLSLVASNPEMLIGGFAFTASQCRDYFAGKLPAKDEGELGRGQQRAWAFETEALLTLKKIAHESGFSISLPDFQLELLGKLPNGIASLEDGVNYTLRDYQSIDSSPLDPSQN